MVEQIEYSISRVERETGISKDMLRMWERRYGFPAPVRMPNGVRTYCAADIERLIRIKKLVNLGHRPGKLIALTDEQLDAILAMPVANITLNPINTEATTLLALLAQGELRALEKHLDIWLLRHGLEAFVSSLMPDILKLIGDSWQTGAIQIHHEHLLTELLQNLLRHNLAKLPEASQPHPKVLLTTLPQELHGLALLMIEVLLVLENISCINLGVHTPIESIVSAVTEYQIDIVCLSLSESASAKLVMQQLNELDQRLPENVAVWLGGVGATHIKLKSARFHRHQSVGDVVHALHNWRESD
jgi:DNA-binding transcriptional MerR regulator